MPPPMQRFGGGPNNVASHYQYPQSQNHLPTPSLAGSNPGFMNANSMSNPFAGNVLTLPGFGNSGLGMGGGTGLASQAAQLSFAGANIHQHGHNGIVEGVQSRGTAKKDRIRDVWASNLNEEMALMRAVAESHNYASMDLEFPGLVARPMGNFNGRSDYHYQCLRCNVDMLKVLQIGVSLFTEDGESPPPTMHASELGLDNKRDESRKFHGSVVQIPTTWQFNFNFNFKEDMFAEPSIEGARQAGMDFARFEAEGIDPERFAALLLSSGMVCNDEMRWISIHAGYDFGFLSKMLLRIPLPDKEEDFNRYLKAYFPSTLDIKHLIKAGLRQHNMNTQSPMDPSVVEVLQKYESKGGLEGLAENLKLRRVGSAHLAGSDSLLCGKVFFELQRRIYGGEIGDEHLGKMWGLGAVDHVEQNQQNNHANNVQTTPQSYNQRLQENVAPDQNGYATPSTPNTVNAGLAGTPVHTSNGTGPMTPAGPSGAAGAGGTFGQFHYSSR